MIDFTFNNSLIKAYFEGDDSYIPTSELLYLHEHPLVTDSFLVQLEALILKTAVLIEDKKISGQVIDRFIAHTKELGEQLPALTAENSPIVLRTLRSVYKLCDGLLEQYNLK